MSKRYLSIFILVAILLILISVPIPAKSINFKDNFEAKINEVWDKEFCCQHSMRSVETPQKWRRKGHSSIRFMLKQDDPVINLGKRAELALKSLPIKSEYIYIYRFSLFLPKTYRRDPSFEILAQWHGLPDFERGETWRSPPLALRTQNGNFVLERHWDKKLVTINSDLPTEMVNLNRYQKDEWIDWVFQVKWSYEADGLIKIWQNGRLVYEQSGANTYNDKIGTYFKIGIYKPDWKYNPQKSQTILRSAYYDNILISDVKH